jgi:large subunit ribosomal protein L3
MRVGLIAQKVGMTRVFDETGKHVPVTLLYVEECKVLEHKKIEKDGYNAVKIGYGDIKLNKVSKPLKGFFDKIAIKPMKKIKEFRIDNQDDFLEISSDVKVDHFKEGQFIDVRGVSIGKGFAGSMKRHNFGGLRASHGVSVSHRSHGSTGNRQDPGRVFKGKKMAGHLGVENVVVQNLKVFAVDSEKSLIIVKGAVPGNKGGLVTITDAIKKIGNK